MALTLDGSLGVTFPVTAGSASAVQASSGRVLQVVNSNVVTTYSSTTSATPSEVSTSLRVTITPTSASNKVLIQYALNPVITAGATAGCAIYRSIGGGAYSKIQSGNSNEAFRSTISTQTFNTTTMTYLDSPATTSACIYTIYYWSGNSIAVGMNDNGNGSLGIAMEIAA